LSSKGICQNTLRFDPAKYSEASLWDTIHLIFGRPDLNPLFLAGFEPEDYLNFDFDKLNADCANAIGKANKLTLLPLNGIEDYLRSSVDVVKDLCEFDRIKMQGFSTPSILRDYAPAAACTPFIDALEGKPVAQETALSVCRSRIQSTYGSAILGRLLASCVQNILFRGPRIALLDEWNNCAVKYMKMNQATEERVVIQMRDELEKQFRRLFNVKTGKCTPEGQD
jgi:hypothetical protein